MDPRDLIRSILDTLDKGQVVEPAQQAQNEEEPKRFKHIFAMLSKQKEEMPTNRPKPAVADIASVTTDMGGGPNAPKHPHDLRVKDPSQHPRQQEY
jgi:hypothetical protein